MKDNIVLIGMPGVGKSTVGVVLAKVIGYSFIDTDLIIQDQTGLLLKDIIKSEGVDRFRITENKIVSGLSFSRSVIATGGSVVYGEEAMKNLAKNGTIVYLALDYESIEKRLGNLKNRGVAMKEGQSLFDLYNERIPLYEKYADITINENNCDIRHTVSKIIGELQGAIV